MCLRGAQNSLLCGLPISAYAGDVGETELQSPGQGCRVAHVSNEMVLLLQVKQVCNLVARRSAALVSACLAGLLKQIERDGVSSRMEPTTIAVDGGLFEHYQAYRGYLRTNLDQLLGRQVSCPSSLMPYAPAPHASLWLDDWYLQANLTSKAASSAREYRIQAQYSCHLPGAFTHLLRSLWEHLTCCQAGKVLHPQVQRK